MKLPRFAGVADVVRAGRSGVPALCFCPDAFRSEARRFSRGFPGDVHFAVKANPEPAVLSWLNEGGVKGFDVASIPEIAMVREVLGDMAHCAFNHPAKTRADIETAYGTFRIRDFVIDHECELQKLQDVCGTDITVQVRVARANPDAAVDLNSKFGCEGQSAAQLMRAARDAGFDVALAMHVGWQARDPAAWREAMALGAGAAEAAGVTLKFANMGGGFPSVLMPADRCLEDYFQTIASARDELLPRVQLNCEPGSALVWRGCAAVSDVVLRKDSSVYLNDGLYGSMSELNFSKLSPPALFFTREGEPIAGEMLPLKVFGPTCDSLDVLPAPVRCPVSLSEGDCIVFGWMGAYSNALRTGFNGLGELEHVQVDSLPAELLVDRLPQPKSVGEMSPVASAY